MNDLFLRTNITNNTEIQMKWLSATIMNQTIALNEEESNTGSVNQIPRLTFECHHHAITRWLCCTHSYDAM